MSPLHEAALPHTTAMPARHSGTARCDAQPEVPAILETIFRSEQAGLIRYLRRRAGPEAAPDLVQDVFLRAAASPQVSDLVNPAGYLYRIAQNLLIDRARRKRCHIELRPIDEAHSAIIEAEQELRLEADDLQLIIDQTLANLPEKTRRVFTMHRYGEMAYREIQGELGISLGTVEYHMMKALTQLRLATEAVNQAT